jgi:hypothetical protein
VLTPTDDIHVLHNNNINLGAIVIYRWLRFANKDQKQKILLGVLGKRHGLYLFDELMAQNLHQRCTCLPVITERPITMSAPMFTSAAELSASTSAAVAQRGTPATLNLDDIFGDVLFTPDGDTIFLSDQQGEEDAIMGSGEGEQIATHASRVTDDGNVIAVANAGGIVTTQLDQTGKLALVMGAADGVPASTPVPYQQAPQQRHHLQYATPQMAAALKKRKGASSSAASKSERKMSEQQKVERR